MARRWKAQADQTVRKFTAAAIAKLSGGGDIPMPTAPILSAGLKTISSVTLDYTGGLFVEKIRAYYKPVGGSYAQFGGDYTAGPIIVTPLNPRTIYVFKLVAINATGNADSNEITIETSGAEITGRAATVTPFIGKAESKNAF